MLLSATSSTARLLRVQRLASGAPWSRRSSTKLLTQQRPFSSSRFFASSTNDVSNKNAECSKKKSLNVNKNNNQEKQQWMTATDCLEDHVEVWTRLPTILGAYLGPHQIPAQLAESIMVAVNSRNNCPYCEGLHGELARMAGVEQHEQLQAAASVEDCTLLVSDPAVAFARTFANHHRGEDDVHALDKAYQQVVETHGSDKAKSVEALCWFLTWGSLGGNTVNSVLWEGQRGAFPLAFTIYYAPLFGVIAIMNKGLECMPNMPGVFFQGMGITLTVAGGTWMTPVGLMGLSRRMLVG